MTDDDDRPSTTDGGDESPHPPRDPNHPAKIWAYEQLERLEAEHGPEELLEFLRTGAAVFRRQYLKRRDAQTRVGRPACARLSGDERKATPVSDYDSYALEPGLKTEFDFAITSAIFDYDAGYAQANVLCLILSGVDEDGDPHRLLYPCSNGWVPGDDGRQAVRENGDPNRTFRRSSGVGRLITAALDAGAPLRSRGPATGADVWVGLVFHFTRVKLNGGRAMMMPTAYLGAASVAAGGSQEGRRPVNG